MKRTTVISLMLCFLLALSAATLLAQNNTNTNTGTDNADQQNQAQQNQGGQQGNTDDQGTANNPVNNPRANACYWGGSLSGMCDTQWEWECGWGVIRVEQGMISAALLSQQCQNFRTTPNAAQFMMTATPMATTTDGDNGTTSNTNTNDDNTDDDTNTGNNGGTSATSVPTTTP